MKYQYEVLFYSGAELLEGPCWDEKNNILYFVSILNNLIYSLDINTGYIKSYQTESPVGCAVIEETGMILEAELNGIYRINPETGEKKFVSQLIRENGIRYNDGKLGPDGKLYVGTMYYQKFSKGKGKLYRLDENQSVSLIEGTTISNGLGFSNDNKYMYFIDTPTNKVGRYYYDIATGNINFDRYIIEFINDGNPDGMCVDIDDTIWVAQWGAGKVSHWNPYTGEKLLEIEFPCANVSSCCVGGKNMEYLFVSSGKHDDGVENEVLAGALFKVKIR